MGDMKVLSPALTSEIARTGAGPSDLIRVARTIVVTGRREWVEGTLMRSLLPEADRTYDCATAGTICCTSHVVEKA